MCNDQQWLHVWQIIAATLQQPSRSLKSSNHNLSLTRRKSQLRLTSHPCTIWSLLLCTAHTLNLIANNKADNWPAPNPESRAMNCSATGNIEHLAKKGQLFLQYLVGTHSIMAVHKSLKCSLLALRQFPKGYVLLWDLWPKQLTFSFLKNKWKSHQVPAHYRVQLLLRGTSYPDVWSSSNCCCNPLWGWLFQMPCPWKWLVSRLS